MFKEIQNAYKIAWKALEINEILVEDLKLIQYGTNITFCAVKAKNRFIIRISILNKYYHRDVEKEIKTIKYLEKSPTINACRLLYQKENKAYLNIKEGDTEYIITLFEWINYPFLGTKLNDIDSYYAGQLLANFHDYMNQKKWKDNWVVWEPDYIFSDKGVYCIEHIINKLSLQNAKIYLKGIEYINKAFKHFEKNQETYGIVHGDFYFRNLYNMGNELGVIDFETVGYGFYLMDIYIFEKVENFRENLFLQGYSSIRSIPQDYNVNKKTFHIFFCIRYLALIITKLPSEQLVNNQVVKFLVKELERIMG